MRGSSCLVLAFLAACAEPPASRTPEPSAPATAAAPTSAPSPIAVVNPPAPRPSATEARADAGVPALSTPNALASKTDAGAAGEPEDANLDPRTRALKRVARAAQDCHAKHAAGVKGHITLRIAPDENGAVKSVSVLKNKSSSELSRPAFETCVLDAVKKERLTPARDDDDEIELPLSFEPNP